MNLWAGKVDGQAPGPGTFSSVDPQGSLYVVYDVNRPESDNSFNGAYMVINPGGTGNSNLSTIWRKIADDQGFVNKTGAFTLTAPLPSGSYAVQGMTYELYNQFTPEQWLLAVNNALRTSYPQRHRLITFEAAEDPGTRFYDWGRFASGLSLTDPGSAPTASAITDPGGKTNTWAPGVYNIAYSITNAAGETLVSPTTSVTINAGQVLQISPITVPDAAIGVNYWCNSDAGTSDLSQFSVGNGIIPPPSGNVAQYPGVADPTTFIVPQIQFWGPPGRLARRPVDFNTTTLDVLSLKGLKRRINRGQYPERYIDLNPNWWRETGGRNIQIYYDGNDQYALKFECISPVRPLSGETDNTDEPLEIMIAGGMYYLWNVLSMSGSAQNVTIWQAEAKIAEARFNKARNYYQMGTPRKTMRTPFISIRNRWDNFS